MAPPPIIIAIDPGREKCGVAAVDSAGVIHHRAVLTVSQLPDALKELIERLHPVAILLGKGTGSGDRKRQLLSQEYGVPMAEVDERHTSELARKRYLSENPPRGWQRLLPRSLRTPPVPYDDYVAVILAERWWQERSGQAAPE
jgi:RNase H-fold protein (predicted Holliday junction resolvase)